MTLVICEDEIHFATHLKDIVTKYLQQKGLHAAISLYASGEDFLRSGITPDIILMDIKLPGQNGMDIMERLRQLTTELRCPECEPRILFIVKYSTIGTDHGVSTVEQQEKLQAELEKVSEELRAAKNHVPQDVELSQTEQEPVRHTSLSSSKFRMDTYEKGAKKVEAPGHLSVEVRRKLPLSHFFHPVL